MMVMLMIIVVMIEAEKEIISGTDPRHLLFVVDGHEGNGDDDSHEDGGCICRNKCRGCLTLIISRRWP